MKLDTSVPAMKDSMADLSTAGSDAVICTTAAAGVSHPRDDPFPLILNISVVTQNGTKTP